MSASRKEILELLAKGKITAVEAAEMLSAPEEATAVAIPFEEETNSFKVDELKAANQKMRWLRVRVNDLNSGQKKVSVNVPLSVVKLGLKIGRRFSSEFDQLDLDLNEIDGLINDVQTGMLVDVEDAEQGQHVQVYID